MSLALLAVVSTPVAAQDPPAARPNIVLIMTDDQGYGDFGFAGNPVLRTPNLDRMAAEGTRVEPFYVSPVCAPTRAALMTGRYPYRTRALDTYVGRAMLDPEEVTLAELLRAHGYATGIFGKWHLGDAYPMRPQDQGFGEVLVHRGGGIGQPSDPEGGEGRYTDPILQHNGVETRFEGYCTDVYFDRALAWMSAQRDAGRPFFAYIPTNAPHGPFHDLPSGGLESMAGRDLSNASFADDRGHPLRAAGSGELDRRARIYAMIENIDTNVGKVLDALDRSGQSESTMVLFLTDNGPNGPRYNGGFADHKSSVREGGIRTPFLARWPGRLEAGRVVDRIGAHIDVVPTLLEACGLPAATTPALDGRSLWPWMVGTADGGSPADDPRSLVIQVHRGNEPQPFHHMMVRQGRWKLVRASGFGRERPPVGSPFELFDLATDPFEQRDLADERPAEVARLMQAYLAWWEDVSRTRPDNWAPPRIIVGADAELQTVLTRQDWRVERGGWGPDAVGEWHLDVAAAGPYTIRVRLHPRHRDGGSLRLSLGTLNLEARVDAGAGEHVWPAVDLPQGQGDLSVIHTVAGQAYGPWQVFLQRQR